MSDTAASAASSVGGAESASNPDRPDRPTYEGRPGTAFQSVGNAPEEHSGFNLMVAAYAFIWVAMMVWLLTMWSKGKSLNARIDDLDKAIDRAVNKREAGDKSEKSERNKPASSAKPAAE
jgi:hypothetical protein